MARNKKTKKSKKTKPLLQQDISFGGVNLQQKAVFAKHLAVMLKAGLPLAEALSIARESASGRLGKILTEVVNSLEAGNSFSDSLARWEKDFSKLFINAVKAGEVSGTLVDNLENVSEELNKERELNSRIKGAMFYPLIVMAATLALSLSLAFFILPRIIPLFEGLRVELPFTTRALIAFARFMKDKGAYVFLGSVFFSALIVWATRQKFSRPLIHFILLRLPVVKKIVIEASLARFSRRLGMLLKSGINIDEALEITRQTINNYYYQKALKEIADGVRHGRKLSESLNRFDFLFPRMAIGMVQVGERSGKFEETLFYLADFYEEEVKAATKSLSAVIEPVLLLVIGSMVGFLALAIITPIYSVSSGIHG